MIRPRYVGIMRDEHDSGAPLVVELLQLLITSLPLMLSRLPVGSSASMTEGLLASERNMVQLKDETHRRPIIRTRAFDSAAQ
jgi:hypothetical protein